MPDAPETAQTTFDRISYNIVTSCRKNEYATAAQTLRACAESLLHAAALAIDVHQTLACMDGLCAASQWRSAVGAQLGIRIP